MNPIYYLFLCWCGYMLRLSNAAHLRKVSPTEYDANQSNICVWLSGAAYCNMDHYSTMRLAGPAAGFTTTAILYDKRTDLQGYVGYLPSAKAIYVVFRGSSSLTNWLDDAEVIQTDYTTFPECDCKVHNGFYKSSTAVKPQVISGVRALISKYPQYKVFVSGHSYGAAVAQLISMELIANNIHPNLYNYGQPRVGNAKYASFVNTKLTNIYRLTHDRDMVPHVPLTDMHYYHSCEEVFETKSNEIYMCSVHDGEDPKCADQYSLYQTNTADHHVYLQHPLSCEDSTKP